MHGVVVSRAPGVRKTAGHGQPTGIIQRETKLLGPDFHRDGETGIEVEIVDLIQGDAGHFQRQLAGQPHRRTGMEVLTVHHEPQVGGVRAAMQVDPPVLGHAKFAGLLLACDQHAGGLVDFHYGVEQLRIGKADHAVAVRDRHQFFSCPRHGEPGFRIARRHLRERRKEAAQSRLVIGK